MTPTVEDIHFALLSWGARRYVDERLVKKSRRALIVGIGRDVLREGVTGEEAAYLCRNDIARIREDLYLIDPWIAWLDPPRLGAVTDLVWLMGYRGWVHHLNIRQLLEQTRYDEAVVWLLKSTWIHKEPIRIERDAQILAFGRWPWEFDPLIASPPTATASTRRARPRTSRVPPEPSATPEESG